MIGTQTTSEVQLLYEAIMTPWLPIETWTAWLLAAVAAALATLMIIGGMFDELVQIVRGASNGLGRRPYQRQRSTRQ
jgi:hypothetical protein